MLLNTVFTRVNGFCCQNLTYSLISPYIVYSTGYNIKEKAILNQIYDYSDYRKFVKDYCETRKAMNSAFSLRYFAQKAGVNSSAFFKFIIEGKRNLTKTTILKVCLALNLKDEEAEYFENLVFFNQAKTIDEKNKCFDRLIEQQKVRNVTRIREDQYDYFTEWYHCVVREVITMIDFGGDFGKLGKLLSPSITAAQAKASVELLLKLGFLKLVNGRYIQTDPIVSTGPGVRAHEVVRFQVKMLQKAVEAFNRWKDEERLTSSTTLSISRKTFLDFVKKIRTFRAQLLETSRKENNPEQVYQFNLNLFPVSRPSQNGVRK